MDIEKSKRETMRWQILRCLDAARPVGASEELIHSALNGIPLHVSGQEVRREIAYLEDRELIEVSGKGLGPWFCRLTWAGVDVAEYTVQVEPGIARPAKYW